MGKRQYRIFGPELLQRQAEFLERDVQVVLKSGQVLTGKAQELNNGMLLLRNPRGRQQAPLARIAELVFDLESDF